MKEIRLSLPYNLSPLPVGYYDRYLQKVDTQTDLNFWTWMWGNNICFSLGNYLLTYKEPNEYTKYPLNQTVLHLWIEHRLKRIGELTIEFDADHQRCEVHLIRLFEDYRYQGHGTEIIKQLYLTMKYRMFGDQDVIITGMATPIEGQEFWKHCHAHLQAPLKSEPYDIGGEVIRKIKGYPFTFDSESFKQLMKTRR